MLAVRSTKRRRRGKLPIRVWVPAAVPARPKHHAILLSVEPPQELLEPIIGQNLLDGIEYVAQFIVRPCLVDEILARSAGRHDLRPAFTARDHMMAVGRNSTATKDASFLDHGSCHLRRHPSKCPAAQHHRFCILNSSLCIENTPGRSLPPAHTRLFLKTPTTD